MQDGDGFSSLCVSSFCVRRAILTAFQEGLLTIVIAVAAYWFISNYPDTVSWLSKEERTFIQARLRADSDSTNNEKFLWSDVVDALKDPKVWLYGAGFHTMSLPLYTLSLFLASLLSRRWYPTLTMFSRRSFVTWAIHLPSRSC